MYYYIIYPMNNNDDRWRISEQDAGQSHNYMQSTTQEEWSKTYQQNALNPAYLSTHSLATMAPMQMMAMPFMTTSTSSAMNYSTAAPTLTTSTVPTLWSTGNIGDNNIMPSQQSQPQSIVSSMGASSTLSPSSIVTSNTLTFSNQNDKIQHAMNVIGHFVGTERPTVFPGITPLPTFSSSIQEGMTPRTTTIPTPFVYSEERTSEHPVEYDEKEGEESSMTVSPTLRPRGPTMTPTKTPTPQTTRGPTMTPTKTPTPEGTRGPTMTPTKTPTPQTTRGPTMTPTPRTPTKTPTTRPTP